MPPFLALAIWFILLVAVFRRDPAKNEGVSAALWIPFIWIALLGSRSPSQWLSVHAVSLTAALEEGNAVDHAVYLMLMVLALAILFARRYDWGNAVSLSTSLTLLLLVSLLSVTWSDSPLPAFRRWIREAGNYLMLLVVLSESHRLQAIETLLRRLSFFLISLSIVMIKYFRDTGVMHNIWTGGQQFIGITGGKNSLGAVCLISGLFFFWDILRRWPQRKTPKIKSILLLNIVFMSMILWLLKLSQSATSSLCFVIGCVILTLVHYGPRNIRRNLTTTIPIAIGVGLVLEFTFDLSALVVQLLGRDPSLTGRKEIWAALLRVETNPLLGVGFSSFWTGDRTLSLWKDTKLVGLVNAHNGYLETYLELGILGLCILCIFLVTSYRTICQRLVVSRDFASLSLALWAIVVIYNVTESAFRGNLLWFIFLLVALAVLSPAETSPKTRQPAENAVHHKRRVHRSPLRPGAGR